MNKKFLSKIIVMVCLVSCCFYTSCNKSNVDSTSKEGTINQTSTTDTSSVIKNKIVRTIRRATSSSPDKNPKLDKVKITGALTGDIKKDITTQAVVSNDKKSVSFYVDPVQLTGIKVGDTTKIDLGSGKTFDARINTIPTQMVNGKYKIDARFVNNNYPTVIPVDVTARYTYKKSKVKYIPRNIIHYENSRPYVYIVDYDDIVRKRYIEIGEETKDYIELLENFIDDMFFITDWTEEIEEGEEVNYILDSDDYIDDNLIFSRDADSLTIYDGDGEITFYSDGSFGGSGNFDSDDNDDSYDSMRDQYNYQETTDSTEESLIYESHQYSETEEATHDNYEQYEHNTYDEHIEEDNNTNDYEYSYEDKHEEEYTHYEETTENSIEEYSYSEEEYTTPQDEIYDHYEEPEYDITTTEEQHEENYDNGDNGDDE